jgi:hypothetical protein
MSMNAEQYRALVKRLEAINEAPLDMEAPAQVVEEPVNEAGAPDNIPEIQARSLAQAHEMAAKKGLKVFRWCSTYGTNLKKKKPQAGKPSADQKVDFTGQATPLGGNKENPMSFAPNSNFGA